MLLYARGLPNIKFGTLLSKFPEFRKRHCKSKNVHVSSKFSKVYVSRCKKSCCECNIFCFIHFLSIFLSSTTECVSMCVCVWLCAQYSRRKIRQFFSSLIHFWIINNDYINRWIFMEVSLSHVCLFYEWYTHFGLLPLFQRIFSSHSIYVQVYVYNVWKCKLACDLVLLVLLTTALCHRCS